MTDYNRQGTVGDGTNYGDDGFDDEFTEDQSDATYKDSFMDDGTGSKASRLLRSNSRKFSKKQTAGKTGRKDEMLESQMTYSNDGFDDGYSSNFSKSQIKQSSVAQNSNRGGPGSGRGQYGGRASQAQGPQSQAKQQAYPAKNAAQKGGPARGAGRVKNKSITEVKEEQAP